MAGQLLNISIGLVTTLVGYVIGRVWQRLRDQVPRRRARLFWGPVLSGKVQIVVSRTSVDGFPDPAGLVGGGDALALREISTFLGSVGVKDVEVVYVDEPLLDRKNNLILLGGPDSNKLTEEALGFMLPPAGVQLLDPGPGRPMEVRDLESGGEPYVAQPDRDYGIIVRTSNPFNPDRGVVIIAGAYGYGSWGGAFLVKDAKFLNRCRGIDTNSNPLECIFRVGVYNGRLDVPEIIILRRIRVNS